MWIAEQSGIGVRSFFRKSRGFFSEESGFFSEESGFSVGLGACSQSICVTGCFLSGQMLRNRVWGCQSLKMTEIGGERGYDVGKKVKGLTVGVLCAPPSQSGSDRARSLPLPI